MKHFKPVPLVEYFDTPFLVSTATACKARVARSRFNLNPSFALHFYCLYKFGNCVASVVLPHCVAGDLVLKYRYFLTLLLAMYTLKQNTREKQEQSYPAVSDTLVQTFMPHPVPKPRDGRLQKIVPSSAKQWALGCVIPRPGRLWPQERVHAT